MNETSPQTPDAQAGMTEATPLWVQTTSTEVTLSAVTALKIGFCGFFGAVIASALFGAIWLVVLVLFFGGLSRLNH